MSPYELINQHDLLMLQVPVTAPVTQTYTIQYCTICTDIDTLARDLYLYRQHSLTKPYSHNVHAH